MPMICVRRFMVISSLYSIDSALYHPESLGVCFHIFAFWLYIPHDTHTKKGHKVRV